MNVRFLGTGTSTGVPQIGCECPVCSSSDTRDQRLRTSALFYTDSTSILIDCGPDFRQQMLKIPFRKLDGVLITHEHYDHVGGLDDLRSYSVFGDVEVYAEDVVSNRIRNRIPYCFAESKYEGVPRIHLSEIAVNDSFSIGDIEITPIRVMHGKLPILGYRLNDVAYITDMLTVPNETYNVLKNVNVLIVNALRVQKHPTHQSLDEALSFAHRIQAQETYLIHMSHNIGLHAEMEKHLPNGVFFAYDDLEI